MCLVPSPQLLLSVQVTAICDSSSMRQTFRPNTDPLLLDKSGRGGCMNTARMGRRGGNSADLRAAAAATAAHRAATGTSGTGVGGVGDGGPPGNV